MLGYSEAKEKLDEVEQKYKKDYDTELDRLKHDITGKKQIDIPEYDKLTTEKKDKLIK